MAGFKSRKQYLILARTEFCTKYGVKEPHHATTGHPDRMREWCALVYAMKKQFDDSWLDGSTYDRDRRATGLMERSRDVTPFGNPYQSRRGEESDSEHDH